MKAGTAWPWDDGNGVTEGHSGHLGQGFLYIFVPSPISVSCTEITLAVAHSPISVVPVCGQPFLGSRGLVGDPVHQCIEVPRHVTAVVKVIECIFQRPLDRSRP